MGFLMMRLVFLSFWCIALSPRAATATDFDVTTYGAYGDGMTDDSPAFVQAWADLCGDTSEYPTMIIPPNMTFLLSPVVFDGSSCVAPAVNIKLLGSITAPDTLDGWKDCAENRFWLYFTSVQGLTIDGPGQIDGQGSVWWRVQETTDTCQRPSDVDIGHLHIIAPEDSPNTDGIDISASSQITIHDSNIQTGDDCVAINGGVSDMNVTRVLCGPGHGISIGSLGENSEYDTVENVHIQNCNITGTVTGLRIKTVPDGTGYAKAIVFQDIYLVDVLNPIVIDQHYITRSTNDDNSTVPMESALHVSDVQYINIYGSSATTQAVIFNCSDAFTCTDIVTKNVQITGDSIAYCVNVEGNFVDTTPNITCI
uniref:probable polygalacturonase At3g15720 isoform X2 n=1 Tax=Erigeron canadensis TaxID=72917 RepID=UPI001CB931CD|nr:probable polygalacturonase At3g15720 isoform X2 [Erigeron canadensis]